MRSEVQIFPDPPILRISSDPLALHSRLCGGSAIERSTQNWTPWCTCQRAQPDLLSARTGLSGGLAQDVFRLPFDRSRGAKARTYRYVTERNERDQTAGGKQTSQGAIAQMGERLICIQEVGGSIPPGSTTFLLLLETLQARRVALLVTFFAL